MCKDDKNNLMNCAAGLTDGAIFSPLIFFSNVPGDTLTVVIKADESVLRTVYIEYTTFKCIPASEKHQASTAYFLQPLFAAAHFLHFFPLSLPQVFHSGLFFSSPPASPGAALLLLPLALLFLLKSTRAVPEGWTERPPSTTPRLGCEFLMQSASIPDLC